MSKEKTEKKKLVLLDSHAIIHRAYHALPDFATRSGEPTGALYGLSTMLIKIANDLKPNYIVAAYDLPGPTFRDEAYAEYKAGRAKTDEALVKQIEKSKELIEAFGIPIFSEPGFEADDILGTIVEKMKGDKNLDIVIASGDMDTLQLIDGEKVKVYTLKQGIKDTIVYDEERVIERFGFKPELLPDYKGLRGDPSDNIIGVKGIGEKTGSILIYNFGTLENLYKVLKNTPEKFLEVGIKPRIIELLKANEDEAMFSKMLATIRRDAPINFELPEKEWKQGLDVDRLKKLFIELEFRTLGARVEELIHGKVQQGSLLGGSADAGEGKESVQRVQEEVDVLELRKTSIALWVLDSNIADPSLEDIKAFAGKETFAEAKDIIFLELKKQGLEKVFTDIELPLIAITDKMREWGIKIDKDYLKKLSEKYHKELDALEKKIWKQAGEEFNINSPKQMGEVLFTKMQLGGTKQKKTAGGALSTRESELEKLKDEHPIISDILEYRGFQKLLSTYIDTIPQLVKDDGRLHATFVQNGSTTGRMSSNNPNLQNIPIKTPLGHAIRNAFVAEKGFVLAELDYSQIELRVAAFLSGDKRMIEIFREKRDIHTEVASAVFDVHADKVDYEMRRRAKVINFGIMYGMGVNALRQNIGSTKDEAQKFYDGYFQAFSGLAAYLENTKKEAKEKGYTETYFGRRRLFPDIKAAHPFVKAMAERMAINAPIQGTEADIVKLAMIHVDAYIKKEKLDNDVRLLLQIHDSLVFEIRESLVKKVAPKIKEIMESVIPPKDIEGIVCEAKISTGHNWGETEEMK